MVYRCLDCGHIFEEGEQAVWEERHGLETPPYEKLSGCPLCKSDYEEIYQCQKCDNWHTKDELYEGWCEECLCEQITYDTFFDYCEANENEHYLDIFVMGNLLGGMDCPERISYEFHQLMIKTYKTRVADAKLFPCMYFLINCIHFVMENDGSTGRNNFANWLNKREIKK